MSTERIDRCVEIEVETQRIITEARSQTAVCTAVSPMSGSPTCDTEKNRKTERGEFITPPRLTGRRSN